MNNIYAGLTDLNYIILFQAHIFLDNRQDVIKDSHVLTDREL